MVPPGAIKKKKNIVNLAKKLFGRKFGMKCFLVYIPQLWEKQLYFTMFSLFVLSEHTTVTELHALIRLEKLFIMRKQKLKQQNISLITTENKKSLNDDGVTNFRKYKLNVLQSESDRNCNKKARSIRPDLTLQLTFAS